MREITHPSAPILSLQPSRVVRGLAPGPALCNKENAMHYAPGKEPCPLPYSPFKACTVPRPIGWLSTISKDGKANLAPYSQ